MGRVGSYSLKDDCKGATVTATLSSPIERQNVCAFEQRWSPLLKERLNRCQAEADMASWQVEDAHWSWKWKRGHYTDPKYRTFAIETDGDTEGLMLCDTERRSRIRNSECIVYVEYLHTAPWNRKVPDATPCIKGIGPILLAAAIHLSRELGCGGRIGLHALPQAESWYRKCGMSDQGIDPHYQGLRYFEMSEDEAGRFLTS